MARLSGETSNELFEVLTQWAQVLKHTSLGQTPNDNIPPEPVQSSARKKR